MRLLIALLVFSLPAFAGESQITWVAPTKNCNGTDLTNLTGYSLTYGQKRIALPATPLTYTVSGLTPGTWWFSLAAVTPTGRSEFVTVEKDVAPEEFVTTGTVVYTFAKRTDGILVLPVGTIPTGVVCDATQSVNGKYVVPRSEVTWSGLTRPVVVLGDCG